MVDLAGYTALTETMATSTPPIWLCISPTLHLQAWEPATV